MHINRLEELVGARLLDRDARNVTLTSQGEVLLRQSRRMLGLNDETLAMFQKAPLAGRLTLAAPHDLGATFVPDLLRRLADIHPDVHVDVRLGTSGAVQEGFANGSVNLALFNDVCASSFPTHDLFSEPLKWLVLNGGRAIERETLPLAVAEIGCAWRDVALDALQTAGRTYRIAYSSDTSMGQVAALRADLAVAALPLSLADRDLVEAPSHFGLPELPLTYVRIAHDGTELARSFFELIAKEIASHPRAAAE
jgi:DNA-binding transcriptional LysR family regulator